MIALCRPHGAVRFSRRHIASSTGAVRLSGRHNASSTGADRLSGRQTGFSATDRILGAVVCSGRVSSSVSTETAPSWATRAQKQKRRPESGLTWRLGPLDLRRPPASAGLRPPPSPLRQPPTSAGLPATYVFFGTSTRKWSSASCAGVTGAGAPINKSRATWLSGKAMTSLMLGWSSSNISRRSTPGAMPA